TAYTGSRVDMGHINVHCARRRQLTVTGAPSRRRTLVRPVHTNLCSIAAHAAPQRTREVTRALRYRNDPTVNWASCTIDATQLAIFAGIIGQSGHIDWISNIIGADY